MREPDSSYSEGTLWDAILRIAENAEYRMARGKRHSLAVIITLYLYACLMQNPGARTAESYLKDEKNRRPIVRCLEQHGYSLPHGMPSYSTYTRMLRCINPGLVVCELCGWMYSLLPEERKKTPHLAIDGKALRAAVNRELTGKSLYIVNVVDVSFNILLYQMRVDDKRNEMASIDAVISDLIHGTPSVVTMDAMGTQRCIFEKISEEGSIACLPVKSNHKKLEQSIKELVSDCVLSQYPEDPQKNPTERYHVECTVDLGDFNETDIPGSIIEKTKCRVVEEANPDQGAYPVMADDTAAEGQDSARAKEENCDGEDLETARREGFWLYKGPFRYWAARPEADDLNKKNRRLRAVRIGNDYTLMEYSHGRLDRRECFLINFKDDAEMIRALGDRSTGWESVRAVGLFRRLRGKKKKDKQNNRYYHDITINDVPYILNSNEDVEWFREMARGHWGVEQFHNAADTFLDEDHQTFRRGYAPENNSMMLKMVLNLLRIVQNQDAAQGKNSTLEGVRTRLQSHPRQALDLIFKRVHTLIEL